MTGPTRFYDADGKQVTLTVGQTFIQVMPLGSKVTIKDGHAGWRHARRRQPSPTPATAAPS